MSIAEQPIVPQPGMPVVRASRRRLAPLQLAPEPRPLRSLTKISALIALTAFMGAALTASVGVTLLMVTTAMGG